MRLTVFLDQVFWRCGNALSTDGSYALFPASFVDCGDEVTLLGREAPESGQAPISLDRRIALCPLPYYESLYSLWRVNPRFYKVVRNRIKVQIGRSDVVLICGPHPIGLIVARECIASGVPFAIIIRQNLVSQVKARPGLDRIPAEIAARLLEWRFRGLARGRTVFTVGAEMSREYRRYTDRVHNHFACLITKPQFEAFAANPSSGDPLRLLFVGRLAPEKGLETLLATVTVLRMKGLNCRLDIAGSGPLQTTLESRVHLSDLKGFVTFHGFVPYGPALFQLYQECGTLVVPSLNEGFPQVINEALSIGMPVVASAVGGIPDFLKDRVSALLVPAGDVDSLVNAVRDVATDMGLRQTLRRSGQELMATNTLEANRDRVRGAIQTEVLG